MYKKTDGIHFFNQQNMSLRKSIDNVNIIYHYIIYNNTCIYESLVQLYDKHTITRIVFKYQQYKQMFIIPVRSTDDCSFLIPFLNVLSCLQAGEIITTTYKLNNRSFIYYI